MNLPNGLPDKESYLSCIRTALFRNIESYSNSFIENNRLVLQEYGRKWTYDPLHQWSRQWEYPFVYSRLKSLKRNVKIFDAGSGISFLPFLLAKSNIRANIICGDRDVTLKNIYDNLITQEKKRVKFVYTDLVKTPFHSNYFDAIYCVSVLEHCTHMPEIIDEFYRILKPQGALIITFDISLDGDSEIPVHEAKKLLQLIQNKFPSSKVQFRNMITSSNIRKCVNTNFVASINKKLLPWRYPLLTKIRSILKFHFAKSLYPNLAFCCVMVKKES
jgi:ubiquinone/menaquinone biosynthesis C-methylase UbiE